MNLGTTLVLIGLAAVLTIGFQYDAGQRRFHFQADLDQPFGAYRVEAFTRFEIERDSADPEEGSIVIARRADGIFWIESPFVYPADEAAINGLIDALRELRVRSRVGDADGAFGTGEGAPTLRVSVGNSTRTLRFGDPAFDLGVSFVYTQVDDELVLFDDGLDRAVRDVELRQLRSTRLVRTPFDRIQQVRFLRGGAATTTLTRTDGEEWRLGPEANDVASRAIVELAIRDQLCEYRVADFVENDVPIRSMDPKYGLSAPRQRIEIRSVDRVETILVGATSESRFPDGSALVYLARDGEPFSFLGSAVLLDLTSIPESDYRDRRLFPKTESRRVKSIRIDAAGESGAIRFVESGSDGGPRVELARRTLLATDLAFEFRDALGAAVVTEWIPTDPAEPLLAQQLGFAPPAITVEVEYESGTRSTLYVGEIEDSECYVRNPAWTDGRFARAQLPFINRLSRGPRAFRSERVVPIETSSIYRIEITAPEGLRRRFERVKPNSPWRTGTKRVKIDSPEWRFIVDALTELAVTDWTPNREAQAFDPAWTWTIGHRGDGLEVIEFEIGRLQADGIRRVCERSGATETWGVLSPWTAAGPNGATVDVLSFTGSFLDSLER